MTDYSPQSIERIRQLAEAEALPFAVYAIYNSDAKKIYIGQTKDLSARLQMHNQHVLGGYTSRFKGEWKVVHVERLGTRQEALKREQQLKSYQGRQSIKKEIDEKL